MFSKKRAYQLELVPALLGTAVRYQQKTLFSFVKLSRGWAKVIELDLASWPTVVADLEVVSSSTPGGKLITTRLALTPGGRDPAAGYPPGATKRSSSSIFRARILRYSVVRPMPRISAARDLFPPASARAATMALRSDCS
jgi:hypothetical protein